MIKKNIICLMLFTAALFSLLPTTQKASEGDSKEQAQVQFVTIPVFAEFNLEKLLMPLDELEKSILSKGQKYGIENWPEKFEIFKKKLSLLTPYMAKHGIQFRKKEKNDFPFYGQEYSYYLNFNAKTLYTLLGLKPVASFDEWIQNYRDLAPYLEKFKIFNNAWWKELRIRNTSMQIIMVSDPLIPIQKMMQWYPQSDYDTIIDYPVDEDLGSAHVEKRMEFLRTWAQDLQAIVDRSASKMFDEEEMALLFGYQPLVNQRVGDGGIPEPILAWNALYRYPKNYRFLLNAGERKLLDDASPYLDLYSDLIEYAFRKGYGNDMYIRFLSQELITIVLEAYELLKQMRQKHTFENLDKPYQESFLALEPYMQKMFGKKDLSEISMEKLTEADYAQFMQNFLQELHKK